MNFLLVFFWNLDATLLESFHLIIFEACQVKAVLFSYQWLQGVFFLGKIDINARDPIIIDKKLKDERPLHRDVHPGTK